MDILDLPVTVLSRGVPIGTSALSVYQAEPELPDAPYIGIGRLETTRAYRALDAQVAAEPGVWAAGPFLGSDGEPVLPPAGFSLGPLIDQGLALELRDPFGASIPATGVVLHRLPYADEVVNVIAQFLTADALVLAARRPELVARGAQNRPEAPPLPRARPSGGSTARYRGAAAP